MRRCTTHTHYRSKLWQQNHCQHPQNANPDGSTLEGRAHASDDPLEVVERKDTARTTRTKEFIDETPQRPIRQIAKDLRVSHTTVNVCVKEDLKCRSYRRHISQIFTEKTKNISLIKSVRPHFSSDLNPLDYFLLVIRWEHHQHNLPQHQSQPDRRHLPSIHRAPAGTCGKGMFPVPDLYRGGDWGWRRLHWIDVSSTT